MDKLVAKNLYKIFGSNPQRGISLLEQGMTKDEILAKTGLTVGVDNVSFSVAEGETFVIMGLSGSGKSTLVRCLNRLIEPTSGEIFLGGEDLTKMHKDKLRQIRRKDMSMVFQNFALLPNRTVLENAEYGLEIQGIDREERREKAMQSLELVGLAGYENSKPDQLSGGMKQRVGLARALANDPEVLLMDEAFSALDPLIRADMQDELLSLQEKMQKTIIFITHDLDEALKLGDRIMLMNDGKAVQTGTAEEILTEPADDYVQRFVRGVNRGDVLTAGDIMSKPWATVTLGQGPRLALKEMRKYGMELLFVLARDRKLAGAVTLEDVVKTAEKGEKSLESILQKDIAKAQMDTVITDLLPLTVNGTLPLAVIDEDERLRGVVVRGSILEALIPEGGDEDADSSTSA